MITRWPELVLTPKFMNLLENIAGKTFVCDTATKEEAVTYVIDKLSEDNWARCTTHKGDSSPETYLYTLSANLVVEYSRKKFGRIRPPEWLKREGSFWVSIWKEICLNRNHQQTVVDRYCADGFKEPVTIQHIIRTIKAKIPWCGVSDRPESIDDENFSDANYLAHAGSSENDMSGGAQYDQFLLLAQSLLEGGENKLKIDLNKPEIIALIESIELSYEEQLMLKMFYVEGMSHSAIARALSVAKHIPVRQNKKVLQKLRDALLKYGIEFD